MKWEGGTLTHYGVKGMKWGVRKKSAHTDAERVKEIENRLSAPNSDKDFRKTRSYKLNKKLEDKAWKLASKSKVENSDDFHYLRKLKFKDELVKERSRDLAKALLKDIGMKKISDFDIDYVKKKVYPDL